MDSRHGTAILLSTLIVLAPVGCDDSTGPGDGFVIRGSIQNNTADPLPPNARLVVAWVVSAGSPDYTYVFGEGTIDAMAGTFELILTYAPPNAALNASVLGVGIIVATTNAALSAGNDLSDIPEADIIGAAGRYGIIYLADATAAASIGSWAEDFEEGYGVGEGMEVPGSFDAFFPADPSGVVMVIDDLSNIDFVNWT